MNAKTQHNLASVTKFKTGSEVGFHWLRSATNKKAADASVQNKHSEVEQVSDTQTLISLN